MVPSSTHEQPNSLSPQGERAGVRGGRHPRKTGLARQLRQDSTDVEQMLWRQLRGRRLQGWKFRRQHPIGAYVLDFYCAEARLAVETDGGQHGENKAYDDRWTDWLVKRGIRVLRFWNNE